METKSGKTTSTVESKHVKNLQRKSATQSRLPIYLPYGSFYPKLRTKENWKQKCTALQKENILLKEEIAQQKEEIQSYKNEQSRLLEVCNTCRNVLVNNMRI